MFVDCLRGRAWFSIERFKTVTKRYLYSGDLLNSAAAVQCVVLSIISPPYLVLVYYMYSDVWDYT